MGTCIMISNQVPDLSLVCYQLPLEDFYGMARSAKKKQISTCMIHPYICFLSDENMGCAP